MDDLIDAHWFHLASQGNIYSLTQLCSNNGINKVLVASLKRKIYSCEFHTFPKHCIKPLVKELLFTYIPSGAEIISIDAYNKSESSDEFVIGIAIIKPSSETSVETYLNIYTEGAGDGEENNTVEVIAQNCLMVELSYTPYHLYHTVIPQAFGHEIIWLLSGNDNKIHMIQEDKLNHAYTESPIEKYFPELDGLRATALWIDIYYYNTHKQRITAVGCECGLVKIAIVNVEKLEVEQSWRLRYDYPVCSVKVFPNRNIYKVPEFLEKKEQIETGQKLNILVATTNTAIVFRDVINRGLESDVTVTGSDFLDTILCSCIADINMDGKNEILLGTYGEELLVLAEINDTWELIKKKAFGSPIHSVCYLDLTGDGVKELVVLTQRGVHVLQHDPDIVLEKWKQRFAKFTANLSKK